MKLDAIVESIPINQDFITVHEAYALLSISKESLYRLIRKGIVSSINTGIRQMRVSKKDLEKYYPFRPKLDQ